jgi:hypothetical protein
MIFTMRNASSKFDGAIVKVALRRLSFGRSSSIDNPCKVNSTRRRRKCRMFFRRGSRHSHGADGGTYRNLAGFACRPATGDSCSKGWTCQHCMRCMRKFCLTSISGNIPSFRILLVWATSGPNKITRQGCSARNAPTRATFGRRRKSTKARALGGVWRCFG